MNSVNRRFFTEFKDLPLPLYMESIGYNPDQEAVGRSEGYNCYHWLQTVRGRGEFSMGGAKYILEKGAGILLLPGESHSYYPLEDNWGTFYMTFGGAQTGAMLGTLGLPVSSYYGWDEGSELAGFVPSLLERIARERDLSGLGISVEVYRFLTLLKKDGRVNRMPSLSNSVRRLAPVLEFLDRHYADSGIGLDDMALRADITPRHLNTLFKQAFGMTAYAYLILLRLRKAKEMMTLHPRMTVKEVSGLVGFRDASHFVATFRKQEGVTPEQFRTLH
ncbi:AraC family transcriptional regulator [Saccharibacillus sp. CPCC 101409]|uniref:AraC family transcriptional regulator n=1 Tax=Saccharibacillus sp. CPCC 101409 TaxID=3058041 RepID=UPI002672C90C|nr:AraC family transcriptional regulator [Saccharibacillus sp. CPCC 101409]MDO3410749.1 AraC family transcriptional regulator [Saccharibacillus sp. CPCC 101409]